MGVSGVILIALLLAFWQLSAMYLVKSPTWPTVTRIFEAWFENVADGTLARHLLARASSQRRRRARSTRTS